MLLTLMLVLLVLAADARIPNRRTASPHMFEEEKTGAPVRFVRYDGSGWAGHKHAHRTPLHTHARTTLRPHKNPNKQIIGIFAQPSHDAAPGACDGRCEYVAASYVKWAEAAGARALPIPYNATAPVLDALFERVNGLLLPGGGNPLPDAAVHMLGRALAAHEAGGYFPVRFFLFVLWLWGEVDGVVGDRLWSLGLGVGDDRD